MTRNSRVVLSVVYWAFIVYLFVPLVLMVTMGFKDSRFVGFPIREWTFDWYVALFQSTEILDAFAYTMIIALSTTALSLVIGTWVACFLGPRRFPGKFLVFALACLPAVIPGIISAISLRIYIQLLQIDAGISAIIFGHTVHNVPFVALVVMARLATLPKSQIEAAHDLGADDIITFARITLPYLKPALIGAGVFCMLLSFDDFTRSFFLGSYQPTLPVLIFAKLRAGMSPEINAVSTVVLVVTAVLGIWAERSMRMTKRPSS
ncbi:ABC transporter permease [Marinivivus vitaminiproducens]|uniref:ABC transporter permease n=1 Tax=Marinivivus vitaminiproducens TaxID=3035935 RepID=UPI00279DF1B0|nr:ABC transporter permease [Geminicoccaceae bacterium SCSIO 64248]